MQGVLTENLWPKLFSEAPRCAPLRLAFTKASDVPSRNWFKIKEDRIPLPVGIACREKDLLRPWIELGMQTGKLARKCFFSIAMN